MIYSILIKNSSKILKFYKKMKKWGKSLSDSYGIRNHNHLTKPLYLHPQIIDQKYLPKLFALTNK